MATPQEKLAASLKVLSKLQDKGMVAIRSAALTRTHRERLCEAGFLREVMKGWYIPARPDEPAGESTAWYASFWGFCAAYLEDRFGADWCLSPEQSLTIHVGSRTVPRQLLIRSPKGQNNVTALLHETSLLDLQAELPDKKNRVEIDGLRLYALPAALIACAPGGYRQTPTDIRMALSMVRDASDVLELLLEGEHSVVAGRLAGAFRNIGRDQIANDILKTMRQAGFAVWESDPFDDPSPATLPLGMTSPYVNRLRLMWRAMRKVIIDEFPAAPGLPKNKTKYLKQVEDTYVADAYHSLSIEGYRVSAALIERVRSRSWNPEDNAEDHEHRNAMAARGYWQAHQAVLQSVAKVLGGKNAGTVAADAHGDWYRELFAPSVTAGILRAGDLAGYRNGDVFIRRSMHVPPNKDAVRDLMPALFEWLSDETEASVRAVLGHFIFVYIHPYTDGNGRMGRFLMNLMLASGGYPWTVIPLEKRDPYVTALESASVREDIRPFANFLAGLVKDRTAEKAAPSAP